MATLADQMVRIRPDMARFPAEVEKGSTKAAGDAGTKAGKAFGANTKSALVGLGAGISGIFATIGAARFIGDIISEAREAAAVGRDTEKVIGSTGGAAKVTAEQVSGLAGKLSLLSGIDDELIQQSQNVLLGFTKVRNEVGQGNQVFNRASLSALNMSARLGTDLTGAMKTVGKALNDPIKGITQLAKQGVTFTKQQEDQIKAMTKSGNVLGAQKIILGELEKRYKGAAEAAADPAKVAAVAWGNFKEELGTRFLPIIEKMINKFVEFLPTIQGWVNNIITFVQNNKELVIHVLAVVAALKVLAVVMAVVNTVMSANPVGIVIAAIIALVAVLIYAWRNSQTFRDIVMAVWHGIATAVMWVWEHVLKPVIGFIVFYWTRVLAPAALWLWHTILEPAFEGIGAIVSWLWNNIIKPIVGLIVFYWQNVLAPVITWLWKNIIAPAFTAIGAVIEWTWNHVIKPAVAALVWYWQNVIAPVINWLWNNVIKPAWNGIGEAIKFVWNNVIKPVMDFFAGVIRDKVAPAFRAGVDAIKTAWEKVKEAAKVPVRFVVDTVINQGIIATFNKIAGFLGLSTKLSPIPLPSGFATGGIIPGFDTGKDNTMIMARRGEGVAVPELVNQIGQDRFLRWNALARTGRKITGFADGGIVGFFSNPISYVKDLLSGPINSLTNRFGQSTVGQLTIGMAGKVREMLVTKVQSLIQGLFGGGASSLGQRIGAGGYLWQMAMLRSVFPNLPMISGFRPGSRTLSGALSYHAVGRAVDVPPIAAVAAWIASNYGARTKELITPWQQYNILNGRPYTYTGAVWNQHNFAGGNAHVHWAYRLGGIVGRALGVRSMDGGGFLTPGLNLVYNGLGRPEPVGAGGLEQVVSLLAALIEAVNRVAPGVGAVLTGVAKSSRQIARAK